MKHLNPQKIAFAVSQNKLDPTAMTFVKVLSDVFGVPASAEYTAELLERVAEYQWSMGLGVDGVVGRKTRLALESHGYLDGVPSASLWPAAGADAGQHYRALCKKAAPDAALDGPTLLALRGVYPFARQTHRMIHAPRYDDTYVLLKTGAPPEVFRGATHAYQIDAKDAPDVDGDGRKDVGSIRPGRYQLSRRATETKFDVRLPNGSGDIPAFRDTDHDGVISDAEAQASALATKGGQVTPGVGMVATAVLLHPGFDAVTEKGTFFSSIACQTAPLETVKRFYEAGPTLEYVLVTAADLVAG